MEFTQSFPVAIIDEDFEGKRGGLRFEATGGGRRYLVDCVVEKWTKR